MLAEMKETLPAARDTLLSAFHAWVRQEPDRLAVCRVSAELGSLQARGASYRDLARAATRYSQLLKERGLASGDRLLLSMADPLQLAACMLGAMSRGIVSVPLQTAEEFISPEAFLTRARSVALDCRPALAIAEGSARWKVDLGLPLTVVDVLTAQRAVVPESALDEQPASPDECAFIQYTSGSCGDPKGVVVTHRNLAANVRGIGLATHTTREDRVVSWLPLHHDMGLIGALLFAIYWGIPVYVMPPLSFLMSPVTWLRAVQRFRGTLTVGPAFAYALCVEKIPDALLEGLDLSSCRVACCGAEPIDPAMVRRFLARFGPYGFRPQSLLPVYGLAESTLAAAFPSYGDAPRIDTVDRERLAGAGTAQPVAPGPHAVSFVSVGHALEGHALRIVDPHSGEECKPRQVGEIRLRGPSVSPGYFSLAGPPQGHGEELATGDLGYIADGHLFVVDRLKDLVIIAGRNYAPSDLEARVARVRGLRLGRVVALSRPGPLSTEELVIIAELSPRSLRRQRAIAEEVAAAVQRTFGIEPAQVALIPPGRLPKTSSGKVKRAECRARLQRGDYDRAVPLALRVKQSWRWLAKTALQRARRSAAPPPAMQDHSSQQGS